METGHVFARGNEDFSELVASLFFHIGCTNGRGVFHCGRFFCRPRTSAGPVPVPSRTFGSLRRSSIIVVTRTVRSREKGRKQQNQFCTRRSYLAESGMGHCFRRRPPNRSHSESYLAVGLTRLRCYETDTHASAENSAPALHNLSGSASNKIQSEKCEKFTRHAMWSVSRPQLWRISPFAGI